MSGVLSSLLTGDPNTAAPLRSRTTPLARRGFNLLELLVVIAVATVLTALLLPAISKLHDNVNIVRCTSNLRQIGAGMSMYADDWQNAMPPTIKLSPDPRIAIEPQELMASYQTKGLTTIVDGDPYRRSPDGPVMTPGMPGPGFTPGHSPPGNSPFSPSGPHSGEPNGPTWDGLGLLYAWEYCRAIECFYCPGHRGEHHPERYSQDWQNPGDQTIYINYHYAGHIDWETRRRRSFQFKPHFVIASDGLRTVSDFNHGTGLNILFGDISIEWRGTALTIYSMLPDDEIPLDMQEELYRTIWQELGRNNPMNNPGGQGGPDGNN
jgi:prepilin-type N-terminal cleavage/methylation domain-containing protein